MHNNNGPHKMLGEVEMFRIRVATAESKLKQLREQAREAKRRRKEAKRIAQQARKQFKQSKAGLSELKQALANAEAKLFKAGGRAQARKLAKDRPPAKVRARMTKKPNQPAVSHRKPPSLGLGQQDA